jgi:lactoylglutathione lyase
MGRIVHIALKCANKDTYEKSARFYSEVFGIYETKTTHERGHFSKHMTDGNIDLALMLYDSEEEKEAKLAGAGARIHHIGLEVLDRPSMIKKIEDNGGRIFSDRAEGALKYHAPDGTLGEIVAVGRYLKKDMSKQGKIAHVAMKVNDLEVATKFYKNVFDFKEVSTETHKDHVSRHLTDGETNVTLLHYGSNAAPEADLAGEGPCIHHWGIEVPDVAAAVEKARKLNGDILSPPGEAAVKIRAPDGNVCEVTASGGYARIAN